MKKNRKRKTQKIINVASSIIGFIYLLSFIVFNFFIVYLNVIPAKYFIPYILIMLVLLIILFLFFFVKRIKSFIKILAMFFGGVFSFVFIIGSYYIGQTYGFFEKIGSKNITLEKYYIVVNNDSNYNSLNDLKSKNIATYDENIEIYDKAKKSLDDYISFNEKKVESIDELAKKLMSDEVDAILISSAHKSVVDESLYVFKETTKIIYTFEIEIKNEDNKNYTNVNVTKDVFTVYISGIDSYGDILSRGRSDVNMLVTINPKYHEILLVSIPRDFYVRLYNTTGYKDKLTHSGFYGIETSMLTIKEFMDIDIDYYIKANFSTVEDIVDIIGGIEVYSDASFFLTAHPAVYIKKGYMHMDGKTALAFARERYAYIDGDRHRVKNQQDVLIAIINKLINSNALLTKYTELLNELSNSFETNIEPKAITGLIKHQIDKMPSWTFKSYSLNGYDSSNYTYSMGKQLLYVMEPNYDTVKTAAQYINNMKDGKSFEQIGIN